MKTYAVELIQAHSGEGVTVYVQAANSFRACSMARRTPAFRKLGRGLVLATAREMSIAWDDHAVRSSERPA